MIRRCRHGELGAKQHRCVDGGSHRVTLNACGDRHCPQCAKQARHQWQAKVNQWSLDVDYVHIVTTLPHELNDLVAANDGILLRDLFTTTRTAIQTMVQDHYHCTPGMIHVLHTWGQQLGRHYHIHTVMTAGGLSLDRKAGGKPRANALRLISRSALASGLAQLTIDAGLSLDKTESKDETPSTDETLSDDATLLNDQPLLNDEIQWISIDQDEFETRTIELAARFKWRFLKRLRFLLKHNRLQMPASLPDQASIDTMMRTLQRKNWISDIQATPLKYRNSLDRQRSIGYLAKYEAGTAIGDGRILSDENGWVTFQYRDYISDTIKIKRMRGVDFHIAFRQHILPARLNRYRTSGLFAANRQRDSRLHRCRVLLGQAEIPPVIPDTNAPDTETENESDLIESVSNVTCDVCGAKTTQKYSVGGSEVGVMLRMVPMIVAAIAVSTQLTIASAINGAITVIIRECLRKTDSNRTKNTLSAFLSGTPQYNSGFHLALRTLVVQEIRKRTSAKVPPRGPP